MANYYPEPDGAPSGSMKESDAPTERDESEAEGSTALLPKTVLGGKEFKPGEEVVLKIVHVYEDEVEVEYASEPEEKGKPSKPPMSADEEIDMAAAGNSPPSPMPMG